MFGTIHAYMQGAWKAQERIFFMAEQIFRPRAFGLYRPEQEHDACGVGLVANLLEGPSHDIVEKGITILTRLMHRGAAGSDPETGDGAGLLLTIPDEFFRAKVDFELPEAGKYAVAMVFGGVGEEELFRSVVESEGGAVLGWREVPVVESALGRKAREKRPAIRQLFVDGRNFADNAGFERKLFVMRRLLEKSGRDLYICSFSSRTVVYKGLMLASQIRDFYPDLSDGLFRSRFAIVHQRYSTNTFPTWQLAHPFRYLAHNGEINTLRGNLNALKAREKLLSSPLFGDDLAKLLPLVDPRQSDSACLDNMLELLVAAGRPRRTRDADADPAGVGRQLLPRAGRAGLLRVPLGADGAVGRPRRDRLHRRDQPRRDPRPQRSAPRALHKM